MQQQVVKINEVAARTPRRTSATDESQSAALLSSLVGTVQHADMTSVTAPDFLQYRNCELASLLIHQFFSG